jgi:hypothetical protein
MQVSSEKRRFPKTVNRVALTLSLFGLEERGILGISDIGFQKMTRWLSMLTYMIWVQL